MKNLNETIQNVNITMTLISEKVKSMNVAKNNKMIKEDVLVSLENLRTMVEEISAYAETKVNTKAGERKHLVDLCKVLKDQAERAGFKMTTNQMLYSHYCDKGATRMATMDSWMSKGAVVRDDAKKYLFWGAPKTQYTRDGKKYQFSDVQYRYDIADVVFPEDDLTETERLQDMAF